MKDVKRRREGQNGVGEREGRKRGREEEVEEKGRMMKDGRVRE